MENKQKYLPMEMGEYNIDDRSESFLNTEAFKQAFAASINIRGCQNYNPAANFIRTVKDNGKIYVGIGLDYKRVWFFTYASEQGLNWDDLCIEADEAQIEAVFENQGWALIKAKARLYVKGKLISSGTASKKLSLKYELAEDNIYQIVSGNAVSKALTNAGFGALSYMDEAPGEKGNGTNPDSDAQSSTAADADNSDLPFVHPDDKADPDPAPAASAPSPATAAPADQNDPILKAKQYMTDYRGSDNSKTTKSLGEILAIDPMYIIRVAGDKFKARTPKQQELKEHAKLLLPEARKAAGV